MCAEAGVSTRDFHENDMRGNWIQVGGYQKREQNEWERTRAIAYNIGRFGQSDPKKYPKTPQKFWEFPWDKEYVKDAPKKNVRQQWEENQKLLEEAKKRLQNKLPAEVLALQQNA